MTEERTVPNECILRIHLLSDTVPGRGEGVAGLVDTEIDHDALGFPYLHGRRIKGLLAAQCAEILGALRLQGRLGTWEMDANGLFGTAGAATDTSAHVTFGHAKLAHNLEQGIGELKLSRLDVLNALTLIRRQTKVEASGAAQDKSLRATRAIRRGLVFTSTVRFHGKPVPRTIGLLAACAASLQHIGVHRARGFGHVKTQLIAPGVEDALMLFEKELR